MNWLDVFCFTSVARTGSFSSTARELMISQQAVSRHIKSLEDELGFSLFLRGTQNVILSAAGTRMMDYFSLRDSLTDAYYRHMPQSEMPSQLRVIFSRWLGCPEKIQHALGRFRTVYPDITVLCYTLTAEELKIALHNEEVDLVVTTRYAADICLRHWKQQILGEEPLFLLTASGDKLPGLSVPLLADSAGEAKDPMVRLRVRRLCEKLHRTPDCIDIYPNMDSVILNLPLRHAAAFTVYRPDCDAHPDYNLWPTDITATSVLCVPPGSESVAVNALLQILSEQEKMP